MNISEIDKMLSEIWGCNVIKPTEMWIPARTYRWIRHTSKRRQYLVKVDRLVKKRKFVSKLKPVPE